MDARQVRRWFSVAVVAVGLGASGVSAEVTGTVKLDPATSVITWTGKKVTGQHHGTIKLKGGQVTLEHGQIASGQVQVDMPTIANDDLTNPVDNGKLVGHLKSADFFDVEQHPVATFTITEVNTLPAGRTATHEIIGELTIKGITHPVTVPATVTLQDGKAQAKGAVEVDRTRWDVRYGSGKFFDNLGDKMIYDTFTLDLDLTGAY